MITGLGYSFTSGSGVFRKVSRALMSSLYRAALRHTYVVFFQNPDDMQLFASLGLSGNCKVKVINGSGVDIEWYSQSTPPKDLSFLMIARLLVDKGIREYVAASRLLKTRHPNIKCRLIGWLDSNPASIRASEYRSGCNQERLNTWAI